MVEVLVGLLRDTIKATGLSQEEVKAALATIFREYESASTLPSFESLVAMEEGGRMALLLTLPKDEVYALFLRCFPGGRPDVIGDHVIVARYVNAAIEHIKNKA